jgi:hypothetical protein
MLESGLDTRLMVSLTCLLPEFEVVLLSSWLRGVLCVFTVALQCQLQS